MDLRRIKNKDLTVRTITICNQMNLKTIGKAIEFAKTYDKEYIMGRGLVAIPFGKGMRRRFIEDLKSV